MRALRLTTPIIAVYDTGDVAAFAPTIEAHGRTCCFAYFTKWMQGVTLVIRKTAAGFENADRGCPGAQIAFGLTADQPPWLAHFLTDGSGAPAGEGLKASAALAQEYLDRCRHVPLTGDTVLIGPLRLSHWSAVRSVTFFVDPDRLAALSTLATYWSSDPDFIHAPFSSGCGLLWRELEGHGRPRAVLGSTDIAMRKYLPANLLSLTVTPANFAQMLTFPDDAFLRRDWWQDLMERRARGAAPDSTPASSS